MAMNQLERATIAKGARIAQKLLIEIRPYLEAINVIYDSAGGAKTTITQENLDADESLSGLTKARLDAGMAELATLRTTLQSGVIALWHLAERA
jgi:hypothetical protein